LKIGKSICIKEFVQPKMSINNRKFHIRKERGRGRGRPARQQAAIYMVSLGWGKRGERQR
jgi:hypothetical protein